MDAERIVALAEAERAYAIAARRHLHQHPELSFEERETAAFIAERLREAGYEPRTGLGRNGTGLTAELVGGRSGPTIALRADIDALPVEELNDLPFRSQRSGVMHACGHDGHTAALLGAARAMASIREEIPGRIVFLFQHAEELPPGGALELIEAGALDGVEHVFGLHQGPGLDVGQMGFSEGPRTASADTFKIVVQGRGGHGAFPHATIDPIPIAAQIVSALHHIVSRRVSPFEPAVVTVGTIHGGTKENVIPPDVSITGTVRTLNPAIREMMPGRIRELVEGIAAGWGATSSIDYLNGYPVLVNPPDMAEIAARAAEWFLPAGAVRRGEPPVMAGEDFAHYLHKVPGAFATLGVGTPGTTERGQPHSGAFLLDDAALPTGIAWYLSLVTNFERLRAEAEGAR